MKDILENIYLNLSRKGLASEEIIRLILDISSIVEGGGYFTIETVNRGLSRIGWRENAIDKVTFELILAYFEAEGSCRVKRYMIH
jgi:hypothetical protein